MGLHNNIQDFLDTGDTLLGFACLLRLAYIVHYILRSTGDFLHTACTLVDTSHYELHSGRLESRERSNGSFLRAPCTEQGTGLPWQLPHIYQDKTQRNTTS